MFIAGEGSFRTYVPGSRFSYILKILHCRGIEPRSPAWQARILPLNQQCIEDYDRRLEVAAPAFIQQASQSSRKLTTMGIEPTIFRFEVGRLIHWATRPILCAKYFGVLVWQHIKTQTSTTWVVIPMCDMFQSNWQPKPSIHAWCNMYLRRLTFVEICLKWDFGQVCCDGRVVKAFD